MTDDELSTAVTDHLKMFFGKEILFKEISISLLVLLFNDMSVTGLQINYVFKKFT